MRGSTGSATTKSTTPSQRRRLLEHVPLEKYSERTITDMALLEREIERIKRVGYALDDEEFLPGLFCIAMLVPRPGGRSNTGIAIQAPAIRLSHDKVPSLLPALQRAAEALAKIEAEAMPALKSGSAG